MLWPQQCKEEENRLFSASNRFGVASRGCQRIMQGRVRLLLLFREAFLKEYKWICLHKLYFKNWNLIVRMLPNLCAFFAGFGSRESCRTRVHSCVNPWSYVCVFFLLETVDSFRVVDFSCCDILFRAYLSLCREFVNKFLDFSRDLLSEKSDVDEAFPWNLHLNLLRRIINTELLNWWGNLFFLDTKL